MSLVRARAWGFTIEKGKAGGGRLPGEPAA